MRRISDMNNPRAYSVEQAKHKRAPKTYGSARAERLSDYISKLDDARGGYTYGDDYDGDDLRALCDIFGA